MTRFHEVQRLLSGKMGLFIVTTMLGSLIAVLMAPWCPPGSWIGIGVFVLVGALLGFGRMTTEVKDDGIYVRWFPLTKRHHFRFEEIRSVRARTYRPIWEYGGWGIRYSIRNGKAYNVSGDRGVQLVFRNGKKLLLGSQRADSLEAAIREAAGALGIDLDDVY